MKLLVLGGTKFLGRAAVESALERGHEVTLFNRGETNPELFPEAEKLRGDRDGDLTALEGREWDAVIDPSGFVPRVVRASAELLQSSVGHYVFVSSISVYDELGKPGFDETGRTVTLDDPTTEDYLTIGPVNTYGGLKALCEEVVRDSFPNGHTIVRAGLIVGPHDPTGRFTYWPLRLGGGGDVLAPGDPARQVQFVDVRDLADWMVQVAENHTTGTFNATGPEPGVTMGELLETCNKVGGADARLVWIDEHLLLEQDVGPWMELPLWVSQADTWFLQADVSRAVAAGLRFRPLEETVRNTLAWARQAGAGLVTPGQVGAAGLDPQREAELVDAWRRN
ncbi:MAG: NAD-dependent epimerase/dehydratase family protein [Actinomycetota bacterium]|nr:NAD-dependent epimerase/dehydratase family protein [Actinomycetota bacterium]MDQ2981465.1 NAD-dependent epimerase/dehydratase family protein [Actinomycetota bacterium]